VSRQSYNKTENSLMPSDYARESENVGKMVACGWQLLAPEGQGN
jgi:hypothetical protein